MKLILIRHGQSEANLDQEVYFSTKDHKINLSNLGKTQSQNAGKQLQAFLLENNHYNLTSFISPYERTRQTWQGILKELNEVSTVEVFENPLLREQEYKYFNDSHEQEEKKIERNQFGPF